MAAILNKTCHHSNTMNTNPPSVNLSPTILHQITFEFIETVFNQATTCYTLTCFFLLQFLSVIYQEIPIYDLVLKTLKCSLPTISPYNAKPFQRWTIIFRVHLHTCLLFVQMETVVRSHQKYMYNVCIVVQNYNRMSQ